MNGFQTVPIKDSTSNKNFKEVIGSKVDGHSGSSLYSIVKQIEEHLHSEGMCYPTLAAGVTITSAAAAWTLGDFTELVPINTITDDFDIHFINIENVSAAGTYELKLYAVEVLITCVRFTVIGTPANRISIPRPSMTPVIPANTQIKAKVAHSVGGSETCTISIQYHTY